MKVIVEVVVDHQHRQVVEVEVVVEVKVIAVQAQDLVIHLVAVVIMIERNAVIDQFPLTLVDQKEDK